MLASSEEILSAGLIIRVLRDGELPNQVDEESQPDKVESEASIPEGRIQIKGLRREEVIMSVLTVQESVRRRVIRVGLNSRVEGGHPLIKILLHLREEKWNEENNEKGKDKPEVLHHTTNRSPPP